MTSRSLWNCYRDEVKVVANETVANYGTNDTKTTTSRSFEYKTKLIAH